MLRRSRPGRKRTPSRVRGHGLDGRVGSPGHRMARARDLERRSGATRSSLLKTCEWNRSGAREKTHFFALAFSLATSSFIFLTYLVVSFLKSFWQLLQHSLNS